jgi:hypothetical protein
MRPFVPSPAKGGATGRGCGKFPRIATTIFLDSMNDHRAWAMPHQNQVVLCDVGPFIDLTIGKGTINDEGPSRMEEEEEAALARLYKWFHYGGDDNE